MEGGEGVGREGGMKEEGAGRKGLREGGREEEAGDGGGKSFHKLTLSTNFV